jgi:hypothetical protein
MYQHGYQGREQWGDSHFAPSTINVSSVLKRLTLEKYLHVFEVGVVTMNRVRAVLLQHSWNLKFISGALEKPFKDF